MKQDKKPNKAKRRATTTVEAALVLPVLVMLTFGGLKYGWLYLKWQEVTNCARQVARVAIRPGDRTTDIATTFSTLMTQAGISTASYTVTPGGGNAVSQGDVDVTVSVNAADVDILKIPLIPAPTQLRAQVTMSKEGLAPPPTP